MPEAITNTSPLVYLHRVQAIEWLPQLFSAIWTPGAVVEELDEGLQRATIYLTHQEGGDNMMVAGESAVGHATSPWCGASRIVSWWDMEIFAAGAFYNLRAQLLGLRAALMSLGDTAPDNARREQILILLEKIDVSCSALDLRYSVIGVRRCLSRLESNQRLASSEIASQLLAIEERVTDEMQSIQFFVMSGLDSQYYSSAGSLFGAEPVSAFPSAEFDMEESGKSLAMGRYTAAVFHLMRMLEGSLQSLAGGLGVSMPTDKTWEPLLNATTHALKALPRTTEIEKARLAAYSEAVAHLHAVKNAWRNSTMHPRDTYTREEAVDIFTHCKSLMRSLAKLP